MSFSRRDFLAGLAGGTTLTLLGRPASADMGWAPRPEDLLPGAAFRHGVASGDPLRTRVILWTRVTPRSAEPAIAVECVIARDPRLGQVVGRMTAQASAEADFTVKLDATGLRPGETYYYQFHALGESSPVGRTRTLPAQTDRVRLGVVSCANLPAGFFGAYGLLAQQHDLDAIVHLGDYIYEYANGTYGDGTSIGRIPEPDAETISLNDYRTRYAQYRRDAQLQEAHRLHPWIVTWDDHEFADNAYADGAANHQPEEGDWPLRKAAAQRAWFEWLPVRDSFGWRELSGRVFRRFRFGDLVQLDMLDTRVFGRQRPVPMLIDLETLELLVSPAELLVYLKEINRGTRQLLGATQEAWLQRELEQAVRQDVQWQVLGQQVMLGQLTLPSPGLPSGARIPINTDQWDGYAAARTRVLEMLDALNVRNTLILTGDFHSSWAHDIAPDPYAGYDPATGAGSRAVEFVAPAVSSPFLPGADPALIRKLERFALFNNPHTRYVDMAHNGYLLVDIDAWRARAEWYHLADVLNPDTSETLAAAVEVADGSRHAVMVEGITAGAV